MRACSPLHSRRLCEDRSRSFSFSDNNNFTHFYFAPLRRPDSPDNALLFTDVERDKSHVIKSQTFAMLDTIKRVQFSRHYSSGEFESLMSECGFNGCIRTRGIVARVRRTQIENARVMEASLEIRATIDAVPCYRVRYSSSINVPG